MKALFLEALAIYKEEKENKVSKKREGKQSD